MVTATMQSPATPAGGDLAQLITALRHERSRHLEAVAEIDQTLQKINANRLLQEDTEARRAEIAAVLADVNRRYGGMFRRLAQGPDP